MSAIDAPALSADNPLGRVSALPYRLPPFHEITP